MPGERAFEHRTPTDEHQDSDVHPADIHQHEELEREHLQRPADAAADQLDGPSDDDLRNASEKTEG